MAAFEIFQFVQRVKVYGPDVADLSPEFHDFGVDGLAFPFFLLIRLVFQLGQLDLIVFSKPLR